MGISDILKSKKKILLVLLGVVIGICGSFLYLRNQKASQTTVAYICADEKKLDISFSKGSAVLLLDKKIRLREKASNDEVTQYVSIQENMTLWKNKDYVMLEQSDTVPYYECSVGGPQGDGLSNPALEIPSDQVEIVK